MSKCLKSGRELPTENKTKHKYQINWLRLLKTVFLVATYIGWGMANSIAFAVLPDLRIRLNTTVEGMSYAFSLGALGSLISTPLGILTDRVGSYSGLILGLCLTLTSLSNMLKPYTTTVWYYGICEFVDITGWSLMCTVSNSLLILMWGQSGKSPLHAMHLGYPIGAAIGGQIARAFVSRSHQHSVKEMFQNTTWREANGNYTVPNNQEEIGGDQAKFLDDSRIEIGFIIISCYILILGILFIIFQFVGKKETRRKANKRSYSWKEILHPSKWGAGNARFAMTLFVLFVLLQIAIVGCDKGMTQYLAAYAVDSTLGFTNQEAASLTSYYYLLDGVGLFAGIFISKYMSLKFMVLIEVHGMTILGALLISFGKQHKMALYILASAFSLFKGPVFASMYGWPDYYITLLSTILAVAYVIRSVLDVFMTALQGYLYTNTAIESIFYTSFGFGLCMCLLMYCVYFITRGKPGRHSQIKAEGTISHQKTISNDIEDDETTVAFK